MSDVPPYSVPEQPSAAVNEHPFLIQYPLGAVVAAYPAGVIRLYCHIRAHILRNRILAEVGQYLPRNGRILELGCGFGLFGNCFAMTRRGAQFTCVDLNERRIHLAQRAARRLDIENIEFRCGNATEEINKEPRQSCIYMLDLIHHLPPESVEAFVQACWERVEPGGIMIVKDVADRPFLKSAFTWILDVLMTMGEQPHYRSVQQFLDQFDALNANVKVHCLDDYLPFPHVLYVCHKPD